MAMISPQIVRESHVRKSPAAGRTMDSRDRILASSKLHQSHINYEQKVTNLVSQMNQKSSSSHTIYNLKPVRGTSTSLSQVTDL